MKLFSKIALSLAGAVAVANAALPADAVTAFGTISVDDIAALLTAVITFGVALFAFRKARSILKA